jgi:fructose-specific phosphotransferase system IIC component
MAALAGAACAAFLVEAFQLYVGGDLLGIEFLGEVGTAAGGMGGVAAAALVALAVGTSPVYALLLGVSCAGLGLLPGFIAGYLVAFLVKWIEKKVPGGLDLIVIIVLCAPLVRLIGEFMTPVVDATLLNIGGIITETANSNPILMGIILGGVITVVATAPLSSMALTAMLGLTGVPMAIGALAVFGSSFMNYVLFDRMKFGDRKTHIISANPIPVYVTNFVGGASAGVIISLSGLINNATGTATPIAGLAVMYGFNDPMKVTIVAISCAAVGLLCGYLGSLVFKNYKIKTVDQLSAQGKEETAA